MATNNRYDTLSQATSALNKEGYIAELKVISENQCEIEDETFSPEELRIAEFHRFEGMSNPADTSVVYAVESKDGSKKGVLIDSYGAKASKHLPSFLKQVEVEH